MKSKLPVLLAVLTLALVAAGCNKQSGNSSVGDNMQKQEAVQKSTDSVMPHDAMDKSMDKSGKDKMSGKNTTQTDLMSNDAMSKDSIHKTPADSMTK